MGVLSKMIKPSVTPADIAALLVSNSTDVIGDVLSIAKEFGESNTTPSIPSTSGVRSLFEGRSYWASRTALTFVRQYTSGFALTSDLSIVEGGQNGTYMNSTERHSNSANFWSARGNLVAARESTSSFTLTSDTGICVGGNNGAAFLVHVEKYTDTSNAWVARTITGTFAAREFISSASMTSDLALAVDGDGGSGETNTTDRFSDSGGSWTSRTAMGMTRSYMASASMTSDLSIFDQGAGGSLYTNSYRFSDSVNIWALRGSTPFWIRWHSAAALTSDLHIICGGQNGTWLGAVFRFSDSANTWISRPDISIARANQAGSTFSSNVGLFSGGRNGGYLGSVERYTDNDVSLRSGKAFISNSLNTSPAVPNTDDSLHVYTKTLYTSNPSTIYVGVLEEKLDTTTPATTVDISGDGGITWGLLAQAVNTQISTSSLGVGDLRLRFNLPRAASANIWTARTAMTNNRRAPAGITLTTDTTISACGLDGGGSLVLTQQYQDSTGNWTSKTNCTNGAEQKGRANFDTDRGSVFAGATNGPSVFYNLHDRFSMSTNAWASRTVFPSSVTNPLSASVTSDLTFAGGGYNAGGSTNTNPRYSESGNTWTSRTVMPDNKDAAASAPLTTNNYLVAGGENSAALVATTYRFSDSDSAWTTRNNIFVATHLRVGAPISSDAVITSQGYVASSKLSEKYLDSGNLWQMRSASNYSRYKVDSSGMGNNTFVFGSEMTTNMERYTDGETYFKGFIVK